MPSPDGVGPSVASGESMRFMELAASRPSGDRTRRKAARAISPPPKSVGTVSYLGQTAHVLGKIRSHPQYFTCSRMVVETSSLDSREQVARREPTISEGWRPTEVRGSRQIAKKSGRYRKRFRSCRARSRESSVTSVLLALIARTRNGTAPSSQSFLANSRFAISKFASASRN